MTEYISRLIRCGFAPHEAFVTCNNIIKDFGEAELEVFIESIECTTYGVAHVD